MMKKKGSNAPLVGGGNPKSLQIFTQPYAQMVKKQNVSSVKNGRNSEIVRSIGVHGSTTDAARRRGSNAREKAKAKAGEIARKVSVASLGASDKASMSLINLKIQVNEARDSQTTENRTEDTKQNKNKSSITNQPDEVHTNEHIDMCEMPTFNANSSIQMAVQTMQASSVDQPLVLGDITNQMDAGRIVEEQREIEKDLGVATTDDDQLKQLMNQQSQVLQANLEHHRDLSNLQRLRNSKNNSFGYLFQKSNRLNNEMKNSLANAAAHQSTSIEQTHQKKSQKQMQHPGSQMKAGFGHNQSSIKPAESQTRARKQRQKSSTLSQLKQPKAAPHHRSVMTSTTPSLKPGPQIYKPIKTGDNQHKSVAKLGTSGMRSTKNSKTKAALGGGEKTEKGQGKAGRQAGAAAAAKQQLLSKYKSTQVVQAGKKRTDGIFPIKQLLKVQRSRHELDTLSKDAKAKRRKAFASNSLHMNKSRKMKNISVAHEVSSNGGGIATNRSVKTQFSKASQRFMKSATPNRSITTRSLKQLSDHGRSGINALIREKTKQKPRTGLGTGFETRSLSLASERMHQRSVKAQDMHSGSRSHSNMIKSIGQQLRNNLNILSNTNDPLQYTHNRNMNQTLFSHQRTFTLSHNTSKIRKSSQKTAYGKKAASKKLPLTNRQLKQHIKTSLNAQNKNRLRSVLSPPVKVSRQMNSDAFRFSDHSQYRRSDQQRRARNMRIDLRAKEGNVARPLSGRQEAPQSSRRSGGPVSSRRDPTSRLTARFTQTRQASQSSKHKRMSERNRTKGHAQPENKTKSNSARNATKASHNQSHSVRPSQKQNISSKAAQIQKEHKTHKRSRDDVLIDGLKIQSPPEKCMNVQYVASEAQSQVISINASEANRREGSSGKNAEGNQDEQKSFELDEKVLRKDRSQGNNPDKQQQHLASMVNVAATGQSERMDAFSLRSPDNSCPIPMSQEELQSASFPNNYENFESDQIDEQNILLQEQMTGGKNELTALEGADDANALKAPLILRAQDQSTPHQLMYKNDEEIQQAFMQYKQLSGELNRQNPNHSIVRSASTKSTKSSLKLGQGNFCNPFCINGKLQQVMEQHNRRTGTGHDFAYNHHGLTNIFNCGFMAEPFSKCMIKNCIPGNGVDPFTNQRIHNSSFNMVYPGFNDNSEDSLTSVPQPIDVGLRGEHHLDTEGSDGNNQRQNNHNVYINSKSKMVDQMAKSYAIANHHDDRNANDLSGYSRVQRVSNQKKNSKTGELRKYLNHAASTSAECSNKLNCNTSKLPQQQSTAISSKLGANRFETDVAQHSQSCHDTKAYPAFIDQTKSAANAHKKEKRIDKYNQMLKLIDLKQNGSRGNAQIQQPFDGSLLHSSTDASKNIQRESPLKKIASQPQFQKKEPLSRPNFDGVQGGANIPSLKKEFSPDTELLKQIVENSSQIKNKFDRQTIINNFFNLQTTEVHLRNTNTEFSKSGASKVSHPSPYIDVQKVFYNPEFNGGDEQYSSAKQQQFLPKQSSSHTDQLKQTKNGNTTATNVHSPTFGQLADGQDNTSETANDALGCQAEQATQDLPPLSSGAENVMMRSMHEKQDLTQEHYNQILNTVMNLHLLTQFNQLYTQLPRIKIPNWNTNDNNKFLLILDIDETMMHALDERDGPGMRFQFTIDIPHETLENQTEQIHLNLRPHLLESLHELAGKFYITSYTASEQTYADAVLNFIEYQYLKKYPCSQTRTLFPTRLYRQHCVQTPYGCIKDLRVIENVPLSKMLIIDNSCLSYALNIDNGVPILPYYDSERDEELKHLTYYLNCLVEQGVEDVRVHNREAFGLMKLKEGEQQPRGGVDVNEGPAVRQDRLALKSVDSDLEGNLMQKGGGNPRMQQHNISAQSANVQHLASTEYLQCDPIEMKDFNHFDSVNQIAASEQDVVGAGHAQYNEQQCRASFHEALISEEDKKNNILLQEDMVPRSMEKIEERVSEEDECTSFKKRDDRWEA